MVSITFRRLLRSSVFINIVSLLVVVPLFYGLRREMISTASSAAQPDSELWIVASSKMTLKDTMVAAIPREGKEKVVASLNKMAEATARGVQPLSKMTVFDDDNLSQEDFKNLAREISAMPYVVAASPEASYPERGSVCEGTNKTAWCSANFVIEGCRTFLGVCVEVTDRLRVYNTVSPSADTSRIEWRQTYLPNSGGFYSAFIDSKALCEASTTCGVMNGATNLFNSGSGSMYPQARPRQRGKSISHWITVTVDSRDGRIQDRLRAGTAKCNKTNDRCYYP